MWASKSQIERAKEMDLLTYLQRYEPNELVHVSGNEYSTRSHDSLKISNGMWRWFSRGINGKTALDYLIHVRGMKFTDAVRALTEYAPPEPTKEKPVVQKAETKAHTFTLSLPYSDNRRAVEYLLNRGIDRDILQYCVSMGLLYESARYHNVVFVGYDETNTPRYAFERGTFPESGYRREAPGSDKRYSFSILSNKGSDRLVLFESAIDLLSYATLEKRAGRNWRDIHYLSLGGVSIQKEGSPLPLALEHYLEQHPEIKTIQVCLDNDKAGRLASADLMQKLMSQYQVSVLPPPAGKDYNEYLRQMIEQRPRRPVYDIHER